MTALYILLGIFILVFSVTLLPVTLKARYQENDLALLLWVGPVRIPLDLEPKEEKNRPPSGKQKKKSPKGRSKEREIPSGWKDKLMFFQKLLSSFCKAFPILFSHLRIRELSVSCVVGGENAAETALTYGRLHAGAGTLFGLLYRFRKLDKLFVSITPDFQEKSTRYEGRLFLQIQLLQLLRAALVAAGGILVYFIRTLIKGRGEETPARPSQEKGGSHPMSHPIEGLMNTAMQKIKEMVDVNTVIGDPIHVSDTVTIIPISKVSFGFASGGSDLPSKQQKELFGGGSGAGVSIDPLAFLVISGDQVQLLQYNVPSGSADRAVSLVPEVIDKIAGLFSSGKKPADGGTETVPERKA